MSVPETGSEQKIPAQNPGIVAQILGKDEEDDRPLPDLPPLPEDPKWRIEHLPFVLLTGFALVLCAASAGFFISGVTAALGAAIGMFAVTVGVSITTLTIAWADVIRPQLVMPVGLAVYVIKYALLMFLMIAVSMSGWAGGIPMAWSIAVGAVVLTGVQVWWILRLTRRRTA